MDQSYIAIYEKALDRDEYMDLRAQVGSNAFRRMSGWKSDCILNAYTFTYERPRQRYIAYFIKGEEAKTLIQLVRPPELFLDGSKEFIDSFNKIEEMIAIFLSFSESIQEANHLIIGHSEDMLNDIGFAYPPYCAAALEQLDDALPDAEASLRSYLQAHFERYGVGL